jgi:hypothetical protein
MYAMLSCSVLLLIPTVENYICLLFLIFLFWTSLPLTFNFLVLLIYGALAVL